MIFGWFGYVVVRGFFNHDWLDIIVGLIVGIHYFFVFSLLFPEPHLGYQDHIGGLIGGVACGWLLRPRPIRSTDGRRVINHVTPSTALPTARDATRQ